MNVDKFGAFFDRSEFACKCGCGFDSVDYNLVKLLMKLRCKLDNPVNVISGCRCEEHNKKSKGARKSYHLVGKAGDVFSTGVDPKEIFDILDEILGDSGGLILYETFVHADVRKTRYRAEG